MRLPCCVLALCLVGCVQASPLPVAIKKAIDKAESVVLYSLEPGKSAKKPKTSFHGWPVLGKTEVKGTAKKNLLEAFTKMIEEGDRGARCFIPRHGVRITAGGKDHDFVICFECGWLDPQSGKKRVAISDKHAAAFNKILAGAKVPLPEGPKGK